MPRRANPIPSYTFHKATGQARCRINGKDHYLGPFGSEESRQRYGELVAQHASGRIIDPIAVTPNPADPGPAIAELWLAFLQFAETYYVNGGKRTDEHAERLPSRRRGRDHPQSNSFRKAIANRPNARDVAAMCWRISSGRSWSSTMCSSCSSLSRKTRAFMRW